MKRFLLLAVCLAWPSALASAVSPNPDDLVIPPGELLRARSYIPQLGSEVFQEREQAERELFRMGRLAGPVLRESIVAHADPEVRVRLARLLPKADAAEFKARTEAFLADTEGRYEHSLPGWNQLRRAVGVDHELFGLRIGTDEATAKQTRELFVQMLKSKQTTALLNAMYIGGEELSRAASERRIQMWLAMNPGMFGNPTGAQTPRQPSAPDLIALLVAETLLEGKANPRVGPFFASTSQFFHSPEVQPLLQGTGPNSALFRRALAGWFRNLTDVNELQQVAYQITQFNIKEALPAMKRAVTMKGAPVHLRAQAIGSIAKVGGKAELPMLTKLITDETTVQANRFPNKMDLQIRDIALAMCLHVTGQDVKSYGYEIQQPLNEQIKYQYWIYAFRSPEKREEALKKWKDWEKANAEKK